MIFITVVEMMQKNRNDSRACNYDSKKVCKIIKQMQILNLKELDKGNPTNHVFSTHSISETDKTTNLLRCSN